MGGLYKKEVVIRPTSTVTVQGGIDWTKNWLNGTFQDVDSNKNSDGTYKDYFFGDVFDARTGNIYRVFSDACADKYDMTKLEFDILDTSKFVPETELQPMVAEAKQAEIVIDNRLTALENKENTTQAVVI